MNREEIEKEATHFLVDNEVDDMLLFENRYVSDLMTDFALSLLTKEPSLTHTEGEEKKHPHHEDLIKVGNEILDALDNGTAPSQRTIIGLRILLTREKGRF